MSRGVFVGVLIVAWVVAGWAVAVYVSRRGHFFPAWLVLGTVFGPLTISLWRSSCDRHGEAQPKVIGAGRSGPGPVNVLVGIDGSPESRAALVAAVELLGDRLGNVTVATVLDFDTALDTTGKAAELDRSRAVDALHDAAALVEPSLGLVPTEVALVGRACEALRDYAVDNHVSLIVVGSRDHGLSKALLGSTAAVLTHHCPVPVMIVSSSVPGDVR